MVKVLNKVGRPREVHDIESVQPILVDFFRMAKRQEEMSNTQAVFKVVDGDYDDAERYVINRARAAGLDFTLREKIDGDREDSITLEYNCPQDGARLGGMKLKRIEKRGRKKRVSETHPRN